MPTATIAHALDDTAFYTVTLPSGTDIPVGVTDAGTARQVVLAYAGTTEQRMIAETAVRDLLERRATKPATEYGRLIVNGFDLGPAALEPGGHTLRAGTWPDLKGTL